MKHLLITLLISCCFAAHAQTPSLAKRVQGLPGLYKGTGTTLMIEGTAPYVTGNYFMREYNRDGNSGQWNTRRGAWHIIHAGTSADRHRLVVALDWQNPEKASYFLLTKDGDLQPLDHDQKEIVSKTDITLKKR